MFSFYSNLNIQSFCFIRLIMPPSFLAYKSNRNIHRIIALIYLKVFDMISSLLFYSPFILYIRDIYSTEKNTIYRIMIFVID